MTDVTQMVERLRNFADAYPEDVFPPLTAQERDLTLPVGLLSRVAAEFGRRLGVVASEAAALIESQARELEGLRAFKRSVDEALNSGDGSYRP